MIKRILFSLLACAMVIPVVAQKELKTLRTLVKAKNTAEAMKEVARLESDSICQFMPKLYELAAKVHIQINDVENEKVYLKKECDTLKLFESTRQIIRNLMKADSLERVQKEYLGKEHNENEGDVKIIKRYYKNLEAGANYFFSRQNYKEAQRHLGVLLSMSHSDLTDDFALDAHSKEYATCAYMYTYSAFQNGDYSEVERYKSLLLSDDQYFESSLEMYARTANDCGKTDVFETYLEMGVVSMPLHDYFFDELATLYITDKRYAQSVNLADKALATDATALKALYLKAYALFQMEEEKACIEVSKKLVETDTAQYYIEANYYAGKLIMNELETIYLPTRIGSEAFEWAKSEMKRVCSEARPYLETYRKLAPSQSEKWAPLLYRIYLELNMGPEFENISRYVQ